MRKLLFIGVIALVFLLLAATTPILNSGTLSMIGEQTEFSTNCCSGGTQDIPPGASFSTPLSLE